MLKISEKVDMLILKLPLFSKVVTGQTSLNGFDTPLLTFICQPYITICLTNRLDTLSLTLN